MSVLVARGANDLIHKFSDMIMPATCQSSIGTQPAIFFNANEQPKSRGVYKTAHDTINYISQRCNDVDSTATAFVFAPFDSSVYSFKPPFSFPHRHHSPFLSRHCALNPILSLQIRQCFALKPQPERESFCNSGYMREIERGREKVRHERATFDKQGNTPTFS